MTDIRPPLCVMYTKLDADAKDPYNAYGDDAGWDLHVLTDTLIPGGAAVDVHTGIAVAIPIGFFGRIVGRSSALRKKGVLVVEGTIDCGFRGELYSLVYNPGTEPITLPAGDSVAQLIVTPVPKIFWELFTELPASVRGSAGFGSSGR